MPSKFIVIILTIFIFIALQFAERFKNKPNFKLWCWLLVTPAYLLTTFIYLYAFQQVNFTDPSNLTEIVRVALFITGLSIFIPFIRQYLAKLIPIDSKSHLHTITLVLSLLLFVYFSYHLDPRKALERLTSSSNDHIEQLITVFLPCLFFSVFGVGFLIRRTKAQTIARLGLSRPKLQTFLLGVSLCIAYLVFVEPTLKYILKICGFVDNPDILNHIKHHLQNTSKNWLEILLLGLLPGIGEELLFRGALQPRLGILYTSLLFAVVHTQYGFTTVTLSVFCASIYIGYIRQRFGTTTTIILHACNNIIAGLAAYLNYQ
ncbi:MAG: hypothetical protein RLZ12_743 [Bacillota bacterium]|jgi:membrane protease YdiL (CAAX protease family)